MPDARSDELIRLISLQLDGDLDEAGVRRLSDLLAGDAEAQRTYLGLATAHSDLILLHGLAKDPSTASCQVNDSRGAVSAAEAKPKASRRAASRWGAYGLIAMAASLLTVVALRGGSPASDSVADGDDPSVARIVRKVDCDWEGDRWSVVSSSKLDAGQTLMMSRGLMEVEFDSGASVTLEAPVSFRVVSSMRGELAYGKLTAEIPESAHGFTVSTPSGETVDLGTRFGMFVSEDGVTETHVFDGEVIVRSGDELMGNEGLRLTTAMALRVNGERATPARIAAVPERFTKIYGVEREAEARRAPIDRRLALWLSADQRVQLDESGRVVAWGDLLTETNKEEESAWQVEGPKRPLWVEGDSEEGPSIRFGGSQYLVTAPLTLGEAKSVAVVFRPDLERLREIGVNPGAGRQLLNFNGPPHLVIGVNEQNRLVSRTYAGFVTTPKGRRDYRFVGRTVSPESLSGRWMVALYVYNPSIESSRLYLDGKMVAEARARPFGPSASPRYIGSHMYLANTQFVGDMSELLVYDTGLTEAEAQRLSESLMEKHRVVGVTVSNRSR